MYSEADLLPLSALQHLSFCERQCALIHIEGQWEENRLTVEGRQLHDKVDKPEVENRPGIRIVRALKIRSLRLGISGQADVVEFHRLDESGGRGVPVPFVDGLWSPFPVEFKRGRPKRSNCDVVQLCAQALCLEEMLKVSIPSGALFYGQPRRRTDVTFDTPLRNTTEMLCRQLHELIDSRVTPPSTYEKKCDSCSLLELCKPKAFARPNTKTYLDGLLHDAAGEHFP